MAERRCDALFCYYFVNVGVEMLFLVMRFEGREMLHGFLYDFDCDV